MVAVMEMKLTYELNSNLVSPEGYIIASMDREAEKIDAGKI